MPTPKTDDQRLSDIASLDECKAALRSAWEIMDLRMRRIEELEGVMKSWMSFKTEIEAAANFRPIETYSAEKLVAHIRRSA